MAESYRLILTSDGLTSRALKAEFKRMLGDAPEKKHIWYIPTAALRDGLPSSYPEHTCMELKREFGVKHIAIIDPEYVKGEALKSQLAELGSLDVIYADMGNTYALRYHLRESGGDRLIYDAMNSGAIYIGASAGSIVAGQTVQIAFWKDWDDRTAEGTLKVDWRDPDISKGLEIAGGRSFLPHANGPQYGNKKWQEAKAKQYGHDDHEVVCLQDGEGFVIDGTGTAYKV